jgi:hypothetical protein
MSDRSDTDFIVPQMWADFRTREIIPADRQ